jgi:hypothetical protein
MVIASFDGYSLIPPNLTVLRRGRWCESAVGMSGLG